MKTYLLDNNFELIEVVDKYTSFIWTDRYDECGDFELYKPMHRSLLNTYKKGFYLWTDKSEHMMVVESINIESDIENGPNFIVTGRSLESILDRRIIWGKKVFEPTRVTNSNGNVTYIRPNLQDSIEILLNENVINPAIEARKIPNFIFKKSDDPRITSLEFEAEYNGDELYSTIKKLCQENKIGFKITYHETWEKNGSTLRNQFVFELYVGVDRSYTQTENSYVIFSPKFENIANTDYLESNKMLKNVALVGGEKEGEGDAQTQRTKVVELNTTNVGLDRREIFVDASGVSYNDVTDDDNAEERYDALLRQKAYDAFIENAASIAFNGEIDAYKMFKYGEDFYIGDTVQLANEYGQEGRAYISEFVISHDRNGISIYPTFKAIEEEVY